MFVLKNTWAALLRHRWRTLCIIIIALLVAAVSVFGLAVAQANDTAQGSAYDALQPMAVIRMTDVQQSKRDGADPDWTKNYLTLDEYTTYATAIQSAGITFDSTLIESLPVRQTDKFTAIEGTADESADSTGGEFNLVGFYTQQAQDLNDSGEFTIVDGTGLDYEAASTSTEAPNGVVISQEVAEKNNVKVGDTITLAAPGDASKTHEFTVQGIYTYSDDAPEGSGEDAKLSKDNRNNAIYTTYVALASADFIPEDATGWAIPDLNIVFLFASEADYSKFVETVKEADLPAEYEVSSPTLQQYDQQVAPLKELAETTRTVLYATWAAGGLALLALTALVMRHRGGEIGNGLILGVSRFKVSWQLLLEAFLPALLGIAIGVVAAGFATVSLGSSLADGNAISVDIGIISKVVGWGVVAAVVLGIIASLRAALFRTSQLFASPQEVKA